MYLFTFRERGREGEKARERNIDVREKHRSVAFRMCPSWDQTHNPGMCPDRGIEPVTFYFAG